MMKRLLWLCGLSLFLLAACDDTDTVTIEVPTQARLADTATPLPASDTPPPTGTATITPTPTAIPPSPSATRGLLPTSAPIVIPPTLTPSLTSDAPTAPPTLAPTIPTNTPEDDPPPESTRDNIGENPQETTSNPSNDVPANGVTPLGRLELNQTVGGDIVQAGETHRYTFLGLAEDTITLAANLSPENPGDLNPRLRLQGPDGAIIAENDNFLPTARDAALTNVVLPSTGVYTVFVSSADETGLGAYLLTLGDAPLTLRDVQRGPALENEPNDQQIETLGAREIWTVELDGGERISVSVEVLDPESALDVMDEVIAPDGESLAFDDDSGANNNAFLRDISTTVAGTYEIRIAAQNNATVGAYRLWWQRATDPPTAPPPTNAPTLSPPTGRLDITILPDETFTMQVAGDTGQTLNIVLEGHEEFDSVLRVIDPVGSIIVDVDDVAGSLDPRTRLTLLSTGVYTVQVSGYDGSGGDVIMNYIVR
ncbi:MAG: hypothetical protein ACLFTK_16915 [Anaerolineales bacterium]